jgi:CRP-like cAMP-binding protein
MFEQLRRYVGQYVDLSEAEWAEITPLFVPKHVDRQAFLVHSGDVCQHLYFVERGLLRLYYLHNGVETTRYFAPEGEFITTLTSFLTRQPSLELMQAVEDTELLQITYTDHQHLLRTCPAWLQLYASLLEEAYIGDTRRLESFICQTAEARYRQFLAQSGDLVQRVPQQHIATYLGIKPETLSRIRRKITERDRPATRRS